MSLSATCTEKPRSATQSRPLEPQERRGKLCLGIPTGRQLIGSAALFHGGQLSVLIGKAVPTLFPLSSTTSTDASSLTLSISLPPAACVAFSMYAPYEVHCYCSFYLEKVCIKGYRAISKVKTCAERYHGHRDQSCFLECSGRHDPDGGTFHDHDGGASLHVSSPQPS
ncbi:hypothetical protein BDZ97DRAFT_1322890 [Flammula alnicola]|nr:hypothetical protein BDZ97DRAFT_1322890 [Flammula alnicola]